MSNMEKIDAYNIYRVAYRPKNQGRETCPWSDINATAFEVYFDECPVLCFTNKAQASRVIKALLAAYREGCRVMLSKLKAVAAQAEDDFHNAVDPITREIKQNWVVEKESDEV